MWLLADMQIEAEGVLEADMQIPYFMRGEQICKLGQRVCLKQIGVCLKQIGVCLKQISYFMRGEQICKLGQGVCCRGSRGKRKGEFILKIGLRNVRRRGW